LPRDFKRSPSPEAVLIGMGPELAADQTDGALAEVPETCAVLDPPPSCAHTD
jgi:hypothetical protein